MINPSLNSSINFCIQCNRILLEMLLFFGLVLLILPKESMGGPHERRLLRDLFADYQVLERPVANESEPILVSFGLTLQQIIDVDEKNQILTSNVWLNLDEKNQQLVTNTWLSLEWVDTNLRWNSSEYGGIQDLRVTPDKIWKPDILMYNSADEKFDGTYHTNVVVRNNGSCQYVPPGIFKSTCKIDITWFPFDDQKCEMKFGSWTYDGFSLDLRLSSEEGGDISNYIPNGEWVLLGVPGVRNVFYYACCPDPYIDITFTIKIRRRTLYYGFNLIIPSVIISSMTLLSFTLPPDSGEKLTLGVTILLSMIVFLMQLAEIMPATSDSVSIVGTYFACIMIMVAFSVVMTVIVLNFHHRTTEHHDMPQWIRTIILTWLPWLLRIERPGEVKPPSRTHTESTSNSSPVRTGQRTEIANISNKIKELEQIHANRQLMDSEEDFIQLHATNRCSGGCQCTGYTNIDPFHNNLYNMQNRLEEPDISAYNTQISDSPTEVVCPQLNNCLKDLTPIIRELKFITNRMRREDELNEIINEWKFAAMVIDRLCLILFTTFAVVSTAVCLLSAPHLIA